MHRTFRIAVANSRFLATLSLVAALTLTANTATATGRIEVVPSTFDFGWAPDNAKITSDFTLRNTGNEVVPLTQVLPSCGCTAADFTPGQISSNEEKKFSLTFNTRGFVNQPFKKSSRIIGDNIDVAYLAVQMGHITNTGALLFPEGDGVAGFTEGAPSRKKAFAIINKTGADVTLTTVQAPASWVSVQLPSGPIKKGEKGTIEVSVTGSLKDVRHTSFTLAPVGDTDRNRFTIAVYTGEGNPPYKIAPVSNPNPKPQGLDTKPVAPAGKVPPIPVKKVPAKPAGAPTPNK